MESNKQYCLAEDLDDQVKLTERSLDQVEKAYEVVFCCFRERQAQAS